MKDILLQWFAFVPDWLSVVLLSALPVTELRASLPIALFYYDLPISQAVFFSVLGNTIPLFLVFLLFSPLLSWAKRRSPILHRLIEDHVRKLEHRHAQKYQRWGAIFLLIFVAIPLPGSGVWTGSLLAVLFGMKPSLSIPAIFLGLLSSAGIVLLLSFGIVSL